MNTDDLIRDHLYLVDIVARKFGVLAKDQDVLQCGRIGLWKAAERWDGEREFEAFAKVCIKHAMLDQIKRAQRCEPAVDIFELAEEPVEEDERDIVGIIKHTFKAGTPEREILLGLLAGRSKQHLADLFGISRKKVLRIARDAWEQLEK